MVREIWGAWLINFSVASRYTGNVNTIDQYVSQTIKNMESIMEKKIIQRKIFDRIGVLNYFSESFENPSTMGGKQLKWGVTPYDSNLKRIVLVYL